MERVRMGFSPPLTQKAHVLKHPRVVSSCTNGLLQLKKRLFSGGMSPEKFKTRAIPLSLYCASESRKHSPEIVFHCSGWFQHDSHRGKASSPSPLNTQFTKGFLRRKNSLSPRNSGPPNMRQVSGSKAFSLDVICSNCSWLKSQAVAARMSGLCR